ncbi:MAG: PAS domain-containing protein [Planctomycetes bacterium]|nr:PAS domain-containing protein [Planctomycetota bacterium]
MNELGVTRFLAITACFLWLAAGIRLGGEALAWTAAFGAIVGALALGRRRRARVVRPAPRADSVSVCEWAVHRLSVATRAARVGIWDFDVVTGELFWDDTMYRVFDIDPSVPPSYELWKNSVHPADRDRADREFRAALDGSGPPFDTQFRLIDSRGEVRYVDAVAHIDLDDQGKPIRAIGTNVDVTARERTREQLRKNEQLLEETSRLTRVGGWELDPKSMTVHWSREVRRIHGVPDDFRPDLETAVAFYPDDGPREQIRTAVERGIQFGESWDLETEIETAEGRRVWVRAIGAAEFENGECVRLAGTFQDIHDQWEAREALRKSEERLALAIEGSSDGLWDWDVASGKAWYSPRMQTLLGHPDDDLEPRIEGWSRRLHPDDAERVLAHIAHCLERNGPCDVEYRARSSNGEYRWFRSRGRLIRDDEGRPVRMCGSCTDVTDRKHAELALVEERDRAREASRAKSEFLANMSHEIRTPMTAILGYADLLDDEKLEAGERAEFVRTIRRNGEYLLAVINDILDLSRIEAGKLELRPEPLVVRTLLDEVVDLLAGRAQDRGIELRAESCDTAPERVLADRFRLRQILVNLVGNAIKFTEEGSVSLRVDIDATDALRFDVIDTGIGIEESQISRIFEAFEQVDTSTTRRYGGTGLGLKISRALTERMGGRLEVESRLGEGSSFRLLLPGARQLEGQDDSPESVGRVSSEKDSPLDGRRILVAEDGRDNQRLIRHILCRAGAQVQLAENGRLAVEAFHGAEASGEPFDLVLMDMQMPELDGYEATRLLRSEGVTTPIIALTAHAMTGDRDRCLEAGCSDFHSKPIDRPELLRTCSRWIESGTLTV